MQVGSIIKSYDFPSTLDTYMIGKVEKIEGDYLFAKGIVRVWEGKAEAGEDFRTVKQGLMMFDEKFQRIVEIA